MREIQRKSYITFFFFLNGNAPILFKREECVALQAMGPVDAFTSRPLDKN